MKSKIIFIFCTLLLIFSVFVPATLAFDVFYNGKALVQLDLNGLPQIPALVTGPVEVRIGETDDDNKNNKLDVLTEIISMNLTGNLPFMGPISIGQNPQMQSLGMAELRNNICAENRVCPANSFFDVFFTVQIPGPTQLGLIQQEDSFFDVFYNARPVHLSATVPSLINLAGAYNSTGKVDLFPFSENGEELTVVQNGEAVGTLRIIRFLLLKSVNPN